MPKILGLKLSVGDKIISLQDWVNSSTGEQLTRHRMYKDDEGVVERYGSGYSCRIVKSLHYSPGDMLEFDENYIRKITRLELAERMLAEANSMMSKSTKMYKLAALYQKYPSMDDEVAAFVETLSTEQLTFNELKTLLDNVSFNIEAPVEEIKTCEELRNSIKDSL